MLGDIDEEPAAASYVPHHGLPSADKVKPLALTVDILAYGLPSAE